MNKSTYLLVLGLSLVGASTLADTFVVPHVLEKSGSIVGIVWNPSGGHSALAIDEAGTQRAKKPASMTVSLYDNQDLFAWIIGQVHRKPSTAVYSMYSTQKGARTAVQSDVVFESLDSVTFPACDADSKEPAGVLLNVNLGSVKTSPAEPPAGSKEAVKTQKLWTPSAFRLTIPEMGTREITKVSAITVKMIHADDDGDGRSEIVPQVEDFSFTTSNAEGRSYEGDAVKALDGNPVLRTATLQYLDDNGTPILTLYLDFFVSGVSPENTFGDPLDPAPLLRVTCGGKPPRGHVTVLK